MGFKGWLILSMLLGFAPLIAMALIAQRKENTALLKNGLLAEAEIVDCVVPTFGGRFSEKSQGTTISYRFQPEGYAEPITVTKVFSGRLELSIGTMVPVRYMAKFPQISLLVPYANRQSAS